MQEKATAIRGELDELQAQIAALELNLEDRPDYGLGVGDPAVTRWELDRALLERLKERAASLGQALLRIRQGSYGICVGCGRTIHPDRLAVLPDTRMCIHCARNRGGD